MQTPEVKTTPQLLDASGQPARRPVSRNCPRCGAGPERRVKSAGFGDPHAVCGQCGLDFHGERIE